jgi:putative ABC transport system permease protein
VGESRGSHEGDISYAVQPGIPHEALHHDNTHDPGCRGQTHADRTAVISMVMRQALLLMALGAASGVCIALWSNRLLHAFLYGVNASDPWTIVLAPLGLVLCGLAATAVPARRAAGLNPVDALRAE